jgi:hypothetical protein
MLNHTLEFLRIADVQPNDEKIRKRRESAAELVTAITSKENRSVLLAFLQGVVGGFDGPPFSQESPAVALLIKSIKDRDATLPQDLKENATELRAVAAIAVGELLTNQPEGKPGEEAIVAALSMNSALSSRPAASNKYIRWMHDTLSAASDKVLHTAARRRRQRSNEAFQKLDKLKKPAEGTDVWDTLLPVFKAALREVSAQEAVDREEIETLWWMFGAYSDIEQKPLADISPMAAAFSSGFELAQRALLPPSPSAVAMVKRAVESGRKPAALGSVSLQDATADWSEAMINSLSPADGRPEGTFASYPALLPISFACQRLRECKDAPKLGKDFTVTTGIPLTFSQSPANWGAQVFREVILQRFVMDNKEI